MKINKEADLFIISGKQNKQGEPRENPSTKSCRETIGNKPKRGWKRVKSMETMVFTLFQPLFGLFKDVLTLSSKLSLTFPFQFIVNIV